ncbi:hypothetical protein LIER_03946 [Lithospermum erythrorhizon]|uniref:Uncharacterized protein n=1 Tax=Lithospermum erythrorhizon TaxID=34254 RepID=A0AAV3NWG3_LITER
MLYTEKPGKANPSRWHRYWFLVQEAFSNEVPCQFSVDYTALNPEDSEETTAQFNNLVGGFPHALPLRTFCDPDVVIKSDKLLLFKNEMALFPSKVDYLAIVSGKSLINKVLGQKEPSTIPKGSRDGKFTSPLAPPPKRKTQEVPHGAESNVFLDSTVEDEVGLRPSVSRVVSSLCKNPSLSSDTSPPQAKVSPLDQEPPHLLLPL